MISWHRFYDPATGRYISADPIGLAGGMNLYAYVNGNPVNKIDPWGLATTTAPFVGNVPSDWFNSPPLPQERPTPPPGKPGLGMEIHVVKGGGRDTFYCCDDKFQRWRVRTVKTCKGYSAAVSAGPTLTKLKSCDCPDGFSGEYLEIGVGPFEVTIPQEGTNGLAGGVSAGAGFKFTICEYTILEKEVIGCCQ